MNVQTNNEDFNGVQITVRDGALTVTSRQVAEHFGKQHAHVLRAIRNLDCSPEFNASNFGSVEYLDSKGEARTEYAMTRDGFTFLVMGFTGKEAARWKEKYIAAFNAMEQRLRSTTTPAALTGPQLMAAALIEADSTIKKQTLEIEGMRQDVEAHTRLMKAEGSLAISEAAKNLALRPKDLFQWLNENGWIYKRPGTAYWLGYQDKCNRGYLTHKTTTVQRGDGSEKITEQVRITAKGMDRLARAVPGADQGCLL